MALLPARTKATTPSAVASLISWCRNPEPLRGPGYQPYAVLTMCRMLHTLEHGVIVSKPAAARWALETLPSEWHELIARALRRRGADDVQDVAATLDFIRYTAGRTASPPS